MQNQPQNDNNLLHFLKNQSLFNNQQSPGRRMSSRSRDRKSNRGHSPNQQQQYTYNATTNGYTNGNTNGNINIQDNYRNTYTNGVQQGQNYTDYQGQNIQGGNYQTTTTTNQYTNGNQQYNGNLTYNANGNDLNPALMGTAANIVTYSSSF